MVPSPSIQLPMPIFAFPGSGSTWSTWNCHPMAQVQRSQGWEGTTGHTALFPELGCHRAGLALSQVDFILQDSCAKVWAALVQGVLEGMDTWHEAGTQ